MTPARRTAALYARNVSKRKRRCPSTIPGFLLVNRVGPNRVSALLQIHTETESNAKGHWRPRAERAKQQRAAGRLLRQASPRVPCAVTITRHAFASLDDDNLPSAPKHVRDGIADALGIDDRDPRVTWVYKQEKAARGYYAVEVVIDEGDGAELLPMLMPKPRRKRKASK